MTDPYKTLGVRRGASSEAVKRAYRKRAMVAHPDRGGSEEAFHDVRRAFAVLSDPAKRDYFDRTGEMPSEQPDNALAHVVGVIAQLLGALLEDLTKKGQDPAEHDLAALLRQGIDKRGKQLLENRKGVEGSMQIVRKLLGRFTVSEGENDLEAVLQHQLTVLENSLKGLDKEKELNDRAAAFLKRFGFQSIARKASVLATNTFSFMMRPM